MTLSPEVEIDDLDELDEDLIETSRTYRIDFEKGTLTREVLTGIEAIKQFVYMAIYTPRFAYPIYSDDIGSELEELLADNEVSRDFKEMEIPRLIEEAIIYDERIQEVSDFTISFKGDELHVSFVVQTEEGTIEFEEVF